MKSITPFIQSYLFFGLFLGLMACGSLQEDSQKFAPLPSEELLKEQRQLSYLSQTLEEEGPDASVYLQRARINARLEKYRTALIDIESCIQLGGEQAKHLYWKARILAGLNDYERALEVASEAVRKGENSTEMKILLGQLHYQNGNTTEALPYLENAYRLFPSNPTAAYYLGSIFDDRKDTTSAIRELSSAIEVRPNYTEAYLRLIRLYNRYERPEAAQPLIQKALDNCPPNASIYLATGNALWRQEALDSAVYWFREALQLRPSSWQANQKMALFHLRNKNYQLAESFYREALAYNPNIPGGYFQVGYIYEYYLEKLEQAKVSYEKGLRIDQDNEEALKAGIRRVDRKLYQKSQRLENGKQAASGEQ